HAAVALRGGPLRPDIRAGRDDRRAVEFAHVLGRRRLSELACGERGRAGGRFRGGCGEQAVPLQKDLQRGELERGEAVAADGAGSRCEGRRVFAGGEREGAASAAESLRAVCEHGWGECDVERERKARGRRREECGGEANRERI